MNTLQVARITTHVKTLSLVLLLAACGGGADGQSADPGLLVTAGSGGSEAAGAPSSTAGTGAEASGGSTAAATAGAAGQAPTSGAGGTESASAGQPGAAGGNPTAGAPAGGTGGAQGGSAGQASDPLEPVPAANCPGYVDILVPHGTCAWFHGSFTMQNATCSVFEPAEQDCSVASATQGNIHGVVSATAVIERFDLDLVAGCPKTCN